MKSIIQIYPKHDFGQLAEKEKINLPPPIGLLTLSAYLQKHIPSIDVSVYDGNIIAENELTDNIDSRIVGISTLFSNYQSGIKLAERLKMTHPEIIVLLGGPHVNGIEDRILHNNPYIDFVFSGESEIGMFEFFNDTRKEKISGMCFRQGNRIIKNNHQEISDLNSIPFISFKNLRTPYKWIDNVANNSAFPISGIRGCFKTNRCDYCSLPSLTYRRLSPENYWKQLQYLSSEYGITRFFETGDTFPNDFARELSREKPATGPYPKLRIYSYPGLITEENIDDYLSIGVDNVFIGIESVLMWGNDNGYRKRGKTIETVLKELELLSKNGITIMPSFILGLPGETQESLKRNIELIEYVTENYLIEEVLLNTPFPLPNSNYFIWCLESGQIVDQYYKLTGEDLRITDKINYYLLSRLFLEAFSYVEYEQLEEIICSLKTKLQEKVASFGLLKHINTESLWR